MPSSFYSSNYSSLFDEQAQGRGVIARAPEAGTDDPVAVCPDTTLPPGVITTISGPRGIPNSVHSAVPNVRERVPAVATERTTAPRATTVRLHHDLF